MAGNQAESSKTIYILIVIFLLGIILFLSFSSSSSTTDIISPSTSPISGLNYYHTSTCSTSEKEASSVPGEYERKDVVFDECTSDPIKMVIYKGEGNIVSNVLRKGKIFHLDIITAILGRLKKFDKTYAFLDIGTSIGSITFPIASCGYQVISFEPTYGNRIAFKTSLCLNSNFNIFFYPYGLSEQSYLCNLHLLATGLGICQNYNDSKKIKPIIESEEKKLIHENNIKFSAMKTTNSTLNIITLDSVLYYPIPFSTKIAVAKIDIEGADLLMLRGGIKFWRFFQIPYIVMEISLRNKKTITRGLELLSTLHYTLGYQIELNHWESGDIVTVTRFETVLQDMTAPIDLFLTLIS